MVAVIVILIFVCVVLVSYIWILQTQIKRISRMLEKRLEKKTSQPVNLELVNHQLNRLTIDINRCLKVEENLRIKGMKEEDEFKDMIVNISHDLRTPLTATKGYLQLLQKTKMDDEQRNQLNIAIKHCEELGTLVEHFYEYVYLLNVTPEVHHEKIDLTNLVAENVIAILPQLEEKHIEIDMDETQVFINADKEMTTRIIQNLLRNCITHARERMEIVYEKNNGIVFHVRNTIMKENIDVTKIFDRFYVGDKSRKTTGLGLSIVKLLVEQMGGEANASLQNETLDISIHFMEYQ